jgi:hypothetical protein
MVKDLEIFTVLTGLVSTGLIFLASRSSAAGSAVGKIRLASWGLGVGGLITVAGGLGAQEMALVFGGLCLLCLAIGLEAPARDAG